MIICVTGTPGTGKTTVAKALAEKFGYRYIDVNDVIAREHLSEGKDASRDAAIVDEEKLSNVLQKSVPRDAVIDSHLSHHLPPSFVDACIVCTCSLKTLEKRLTTRGYGKEKVRENLDAEIFKTCETEAREAGHTVLVMETSQGFEVDALLKRLAQLKDTEK